MKMNKKTIPSKVDLSRTQLKEYVSIEKFNADNEKVEGLSEDLEAYAAGTDHHLASHDEAIGRLEKDVESKADIADVTQHKKTVASKSQSGHVLIGDGIRVDNEGRISVESGGLEPATTSKIGGVIIGDGIRVDGKGRISADELKPATKSSLGGIIPGYGLVVDEYGILSTLEQVIHENTGPGPKRLMAGTLEQGFFGEVPSSEIITAEELSLEVGVTQGTVQFNEGPWLKFALDGKILFRPKKAIRRAISYDHLEEKGVIKGEKVIEIGGLKYKVRLMKGLADEYDYYEYSSGRAKYSEWNRLILPTHEQARDKSWKYPQYVEDDVPYWGIDYTDADLQVASGGGEGVWCQEYTASDSPLRVMRGYRGASGLYNTTSSGTASSYGWAPVLELLPS